MDPQIADLRVSYDTGALAVADLDRQPLAAFSAWFTAANSGEVIEPNAMVLATADAAGAPSTRTVLLKAADSRGFTFYTNLHSRKSRELHANPNTSATFPWFSMHRQVVVVGRAELVARDEVAEYFASRPRDSQIGAWVSRQSEVIEDRSILDERFHELVDDYVDIDVPLPDFWGGWLIRPVTIEFWQGRTSRLHDRLRFTARHAEAALDDPSAWTLERLSP
ncbi:MAG: pyridoxamine 5'-phosphate oxidase [Actinomycetota bacterium]|nr:pyridoxamine 5'-phosphate oxidase [Actinomycetota bacterium]